MTQGSLVRIVAVCWLASLTACSRLDVIVDDWGPPAGFGAVQGTIQQASTLPAPGIRVAVARCDPPLGAGEAISNDQGRYRVEISLPPIGLFVPASADTLHLHCTIFVGERGNPTLTDTVTLGFASARGAVVPSARDFTLP